MERPSYSAVPELSAEREPLTREELRELGGAVIKAVNAAEIADPAMRNTDVSEAAIDAYIEDPIFGVGINPETGNFDAALLPRSENDAQNIAHDKVRAGDDMTIQERLLSGRDRVTRVLGEGMEAGALELRSDRAYRATTDEEIQQHLLTGYIEGRTGSGDEYTEADDGTNNNKGIDWYLGAAAERYGDVIIEAPARPDYFQLANDNGTHLAHGGAARHIKSSGHNHPVPIDMANVIYRNEEGVYVRVPFSELAPGSSEDSRQY